MTNLCICWSLCKSSWSKSYGWLSLCSPHITKLFWVGLHIVWYFLSTLQKYDVFIISPTTRVACSSCWHCCNKLWVHFWCALYWLWQCTVADNNIARLRRIVVFARNGSRQTCGVFMLCDNSYHWQILECKLYFCKWQKIWITNS